jgi:hypothetical protein
MMAGATAIKVRACGIRSTILRPTRELSSAMGAATAAATERVSVGSVPVRRYPAMRVRSIAMPIAPAVKVGSPCAGQTQTRTTLAGSPHAEERGVALVTTPPV